MDEDSNPPEAWSDEDDESLDNQPVLDFESVPSGDDGLLPLEYQESDQTSTWKAPPELNYNKVDLVFISEAKVNKSREILINLIRSFLVVHVLTAISCKQKNL